MAEHFIIGGIIIVATTLIGMIGSYAKGRIDQSKPQWKSVLDELPNGTQDVLVYVPDYPKDLGALIGRYFHKDRFEGWHVYNHIQNVSGTEYYPTHWMELPGSPDTNN